MAPPAPVAPHVTYSQQYRRCRKPGCRLCGHGGSGHGPYWFAYWREDGRLRSRYLGKELPPGAAPAQKRAARAALRVRTLGGLQVWRGATALPAASWRRRDVTALFTCLLSAPDHRLHREQLLATLWPDAEPETAIRRLHTTLHVLRKVLDEPGAEQSVLQLAGGVLALHPGGGPRADDWLDAAAFARAAHTALGSADRAAGRAALDLYTGAYLPEEPYADWVVARREELAQKHVLLLLHLARLSSTVGDRAEAEQSLRAVLVQDACHEEAAVLLMELLATAGRRGEALRVYQALATRLEADLGLAPGREAEELRARLLAQGGALWAAERPGSPPPAAPARPRTNLPEALTSFVGRAWEQGEVRAMLAGGAPDGRAACRLLTLTGAGGCGKTRLALEVARGLLPAYPDGAWLVELGGLAAPAQVPRAVAAILGVREDRAAGDLPLVEALAEHLRGRRALVVLDNCEHLLGACAELVSILLQASAELRILATSREALGIGGETAWRVPPLAVPPALEMGGAGPAYGVGADDAGRLPAHDHGHGHAVDAALLDHLRRFEAVQLFLARAATVRSGFALTAGNAAAIVHICRRLDGIPLAIELAAALVRVLSVEEIAARLDDRFRLLAGGSRTALLRHQTLRAAIDWSYNLLAEDERGMLRQLAVFAGGWTLEAAEQVAWPVSESPEAPDPGADARRRLPPADSVLGVLARLVDKSLVVVDENAATAGGAGPARGTRYRLLETLRSYAWERLAESGQLAAAQRRHAAYFVGLAEAAAPALLGPHQAAWLERLDAEQANLRAALDWARGHGETIIGLRLAGALGRFWQSRGYAGEERGWVDELLSAAAAGAAAPPLRAAALVTAGALAQVQGDYPRAILRYEEALALLREAGDVPATARPLSALGTLAYERGDFTRAAALHGQALLVQRAGGDSAGIATSLNNLAIVAANQGHYARATALYEEALALHREMGNGLGVAQSLDGLGWIATRRADYPTAMALYEESLALRRDLGDTLMIAYSLSHAGTVAEAQGDLARAAALHAESLALYRAVRARRGMAWSLKDLGTIASRQGDHDRAAALHAESLVLHREIGNGLGIAEALTDAGWAAIRRGAHTRALALFREGIGVWQQVCAPTGIPACLEGLAAVAEARGHPEHATRLLGAAAAARLTLHVPLPPLDRTAGEHAMASLTDALGEPRFAAAWAAGQAMTLEQASALDGLPPA
jgi:predicted ATPase/DNA-binding SARP family transcriptional activator